MVSDKIYLTTYNYNIIVGYYFIFFLTYVWFVLGVYQLQETWNKFIETYVKQS